MCLNGYFESRVVDFRVAIGRKPLYDNGLADFIDVAIYNQSFLSLWCNGIGIIAF